MHPVHKPPRDATDVCTLCSIAKVLSSQVKNCVDLTVTNFPKVTPNQLVVSHPPLISARMSLL